MVDGASSRSLLDVADAAERAGVRAVWLPEGSDTDPIAVAAAMAVRTRTIRSATGVVGIWSRSVVTMAMQAATVAALSNGRFILGLGVQAEPKVTGWHGRPPFPPVSAMREYLIVLRAILAGQRVNFEGRYVRVRDFRLGTELPVGGLRIYLAAIGPRMARLAGELADGVVGDGFSLPYLRDVVIPNVRRGAERAGRSLSEVDVGCAFPTCVGDANALVGMRARVVMYATASQSSPAYRANLEHAGFAREAREAEAAVAGGDLQRALDSIPEAMVSATTLTGPLNVIRRRLSAFREAGLTTAILCPATPGRLVSFYPGHLSHATIHSQPRAATYANSLDAVLQAIPQLRAANDARAS